MLIVKDLVSQTLNDNVYPYISVFITMLNVAIICTTGYPLLACITRRKHIVANILGILYTTPW